MSDPLSRFEQRVRRVEKPWGYELHYALTDRYCGKVLFVRAGEALSLQYHERKDETLYVFQGRVSLEIDGARETVEAGRAFHVRPGTAHRISALEDAFVLETSTPELEDVVRLEDRYGRAG
jgi:mannose-6-phosphate isomerase-like protein (cupin superfamily)